MIKPNRNYKHGLSRLIEKSGKTQKQIAKESDLSEFVICSAKTGRRTLKLSEAVSICESCGVTVNYLIKLSEVPE